MRWLVLIAVLGGCGSLVDGDYAGEPLVSVRGMAVSARSLSDSGSSSFGGAVRWQGVAGDPGLVRQPLEPEFPVFWIDVIAWPADAAMLQLDAGPAFAEGYLHIVRADLGDQVGPSDILATELDHVLVYVSAAVAPDGATAAYLGAALAPGFHLALRHATDAPSAAQQALVEQCVAASDGSDRARAVCTAQRSYQLAPAPDDLDTLLGFTVLL